MLPTGWEEQKLELPGKKAGVKNDKTVTTVAIVWTWTKQTKSKKCLPSLMLSAWKRRRAKHSPIDDCMFQLFSFGNSPFSCRSKSLILILELFVVTLGLPANLVLVVLWFSIEKLDPIRTCKSNIRPWNPGWAVGRDDNNIWFGLSRCLCCSLNCGNVDGLIGWYEGSQTGKKKYVKHQAKCPHNSSLYFQRNA